MCRCGTVPVMTSVRHDETTVAIVGAGPAGLVIAHILQQAGIEFVLLERHAQSDMGSMAKAGAIDYRTVEALKSVNIADRILTFDETNYCCEFRTPEESVVFDYGTITGDRPHYVYPQHELVARLRDALVVEGGDIRFGLGVSRVDRDDSGVTLSLVDESGRHSAIRCRVVAGCDGARSTIAGALRGCKVVASAAYRSGV